MYCRRPDPAEVFHISVLALLMLFPLHRLVDRRTSLNADYSEASSLSVQTPERGFKPGFDSRLRVTPEKPSTPKISKWNGLDP